MDLAALKFSGEMYLKKFFKSNFYFQNKTNTVPRRVDPVIHNIDLETFQRPFGTNRGQTSASQFDNQEPPSPLSSPTDSPRPSSPAVPIKVSFTSCLLQHIYCTLLFFGENMLM